ncbi:YceI family protein [Alteromonas sp. 5E99-2]|uniref:YceI family protein n=1 Tax=Alteromonas sp. 5E99-2 TaxID=2817683 RepID=UPI001A9903C4|nr:YceI family protein [Alteromonas sp. 5E99-2]MBO1254442.1 YceI family protein [Alteromonas sp. 5E99-2]
MLKRLFTLSLFLFNTTVFAEKIETNSTTSKLSFSGQHAGRDFTGVFNSWNATLVLPPSEDASIQATFQVSSAETGNALYDETLTEEDWFAADKHPTARFTSTSIESTSSGYKVIGTLVLRGKSGPVEFELEETKDGLIATFSIDRLSFGIGEESDPTAEWVSREIGLQLTIKR